MFVERTRPFIRGMDHIYRAFVIHTDTVCVALHVATVGTCLSFCQPDSLTSELQNAEVTTLKHCGILKT